MPTVRRFLAHRHLAALLCAATLLLKLIVPAGYMVGGEPGHITITLCSGVAAQPMAMPEPMAMPGMHHAPAHGDHGKTASPCAFAGLAAASLGAVDPIAVIAPAVLAAVVGRFPAVAPAQRRAWLRPPLRGPPARA